MGEALLYIATVVIAVVALFICGVTCCFALKMYGDYSRALRELIWAIYMFWFLVATVTIKILG